jgi:hypothetical protein
MKIRYFFLYLWVNFALLDPDPATHINADPDPAPATKIFADLDQATKINADQDTQPCHLAEGFFPLVLCWKLMKACVAGTWRWRRATCR